MIKENEQNSDFIFFEESWNINKKTINSSNDLSG